MPIHNLITRSLTSLKGLNMSLYPVSNGHIGIFSWLAFHSSFTPNFVELTRITMQIENQVGGELTLYRLMLSNDRFLRSFTCILYANFTVAILSKFFINRFNV